MAKRLTNKRLVKYLMDVRRIEMIRVRAKNIIVQVTEKFTAQMGKNLMEEVGHGETARIATKDGNNYNVVPRY